MTETEQKPESRTKVAQSAGATPEIKALQAEVKRLKDRQSQCETMDEAEKLALIRALQEIRDAIGMIGGDRVSPKQIVDEVRRNANQK